MAVSLGVALRRLVAAIGLVVFIVVPGIHAKPAPPPHHTAQAQDCVVYVTKTGHKYHRAGCQYLKSSAFKMSRSEAIKGGYTPCKKCGGSECE